MIVKMWATMHEQCVVTHTSATSASEPGSISYSDNENLTSTWSTEQYFELCMIMWHGYGCYKI
jgi:hypothetical protein